MWHVGCIGDFCNGRVDIDEAGCEEGDMQGCETFAMVEQIDEAGCAKGDMQVYSMHSQ
jgi:hypothetical protein